MIGLERVLEWGAGWIPWLWVTSWRVALLFALVALISRLLRRRVEAVCALWRATTILFLVLLFLPTTLPGSSGWFPMVSPWAPTKERSQWPSTDSSTSSAAAESSALGSRSSGSHLVRSLDLPLPDRAPRGARASAKQAQSTTRDDFKLDSAPRSARTFVATAAGALGGVWLLGLIVQCTRLIVGAGRLAHRVREARPLLRGAWTGEWQRLARTLGVRKPILGKITSWPAAPVLCGWRTPVILVPKSFPAWPASRQRAVLTHELSHLVSGDLWFVRLAGLLSAVFWFHPAVRWSARQLARYQELRCDRLVLQQGIDAVQYANSLVIMARDAAHGSAMSVPFSRRGLLEERVREILGACSPARGTQWVTMLALLCTVGSASAIQGRVDPTSPPQERSPDVDAPADVLFQPTDPKAPTPSELPGFLQALCIDVNRDVVIRQADALGMRILRERGVINALALSDQFEFSIQDSTGFLEEISPDLGGNEPLEVLVPSEMSLAVKIHRGSLDCHGVFRSLLATTSLGSIEVDASEGVVECLDLHAANGSIGIDCGELSGTVRAVCGRGRVAMTLDDPHSRGSLWLSAGRGDVMLSMAARLDAKLDTLCPLGTVRGLPFETTPDSAPLTGHLQSATGDITVQRFSFGEESSSH